MWSSHGFFHQAGLYCALDSSQSRQAETRGTFFRKKINSMELAGIMFIVVGNLILILTRT